MKQSHRNRGKVSWGVLSIIGGITCIAAIVAVNKESITVVENNIPMIETVATSTEDVEVSKWDTKRVKNDPQFIELMDVKAEQKAIEAYIAELTATFEAEKEAAEAEMTAKRAREIELVDALELSLP